MKSIVFLVDMIDDRQQISVAEEWPIDSYISGEFIRFPPDYMEVDGSNLRINVHNGHAVYKILEYSYRHDWYELTLIDSAYQSDKVDA